MGEKDKFITNFSNLLEKFIDEQIVGCADSIQPEQVVFYSAVFNYNLGDFLRAITKTLGHLS